MAVRNFYVVADVDGRSSQVTGGPIRKDGGMTISLTMRDNGAIRDVLTIYCQAHDDGGLVVEVVDDATRKTVVRYDSER
jgi:hypothetical protein